MQETLVHGHAASTSSFSAAWVRAMSGGSRTCHECGATNLDDALFCASCGVALSREHLHHPGLAALVGEEAEQAAADETVRSTGTPPTVDPAGTAPAASTTAGLDPTVRRPATSDPDVTVPASTPASADATVPTPAAAPPTAATATTSFTPQGPAHVGPPTSTGGPVPVGPSSRPWVLPTVLVAIVVVLAAIVVAVLAGRSGDDSTTSTAAPITEPPATAAPTTAAPTDPVATTQPPDTTTPETTAPETSAPETTTAPTEPPDAATQLVELANDDLPRALALRERWVPQLSAKEDGTVWEGVTYDLAGILALHQQLSAQVGGALLVEGSSLAFLRDGERMAGWWFTVADVDFDDPDAALQWCEDEGFTRENCAARLLTDRDDATGTLRLRPEPSE